MISRVATWRPVPYGIHIGQTPDRFLFRRRLHRAVIIHTNGAGDHDVPDDLSLYQWWLSKARQGSRIGAQLQVMTSGQAEQYVDTDLVVAHAYDASWFAPGIEVEDDGIRDLPMNPAQIDTIVGLLKELKVPPRLLECHPGDGIGWHRQCDRWNKSAHRCPGPVREAQIMDEIIPRLQYPEGEDMTDEQAKQLQKVFNFVNGVASFEDTDAVTAGKHLAADARKGATPIDIPALAAAIVAKLPPMEGAPSADEIAVATRALFKEMPLS